MSSLVSPYVFVCMSRKAPNFEEGLCSNMWTMEEECNKCWGLGHQSTSQTVSEILKLSADLPSVQSGMHTQNRTNIVMI